MIAVLIFWLMIFLVFWTYVGYFVLLFFNSRFRSLKVDKQRFTPFVTMVITAYNEEQNINKKIENCLSLKYPKDKLEIIIVSDGSTDRTNEIIESYGNHGIKHLAMPMRNGKDYSQGRGTAIATGEIIVYTDVTTFLYNEALGEIVGNFADPKIGCVSGYDSMPAGTAGAGEGFYVRYEMTLRALESKANTSVVVSGCFFAVRKFLCRNWYPDLTSDFYLPIICQMEGYRVVLDSSAIAIYNALDEPQKEFQRKVRTVVNGLSVLLRFKKSLNLFHYGFYSLQMISHKLIRWLVPYCLILIVIMNLFLWEYGVFYRILLGFQTVFYMMALMAYLAKKLRNLTIFKIPLFFSLVNLSILIAWSNFMFGKKHTIWEPTKR